MQFFPSIKEPIFSDPNPLGKEILEAGKQGGKAFIAAEEDLKFCQKLVVDIKSVISEKSSNITEGPSNTTSSSQDPSQETESGLRKGFFNN